VAFRVDMEKLGRETTFDEVRLTEKARSAAANGDTEAVVKG